MRQLWDFLLANPILFFVLAAWVAGAVGNAIKTKSGQRKAGERQTADQRAGRQLQPKAEKQPPPLADKRSLADRPVPIRRASLDAQPSRAEPPPIKRQPQATAGAGSPDEIAAEMRRILGLDVDTGPAVRERAEPVRREPRRVPVQPERPPTAVKSAMQSRHLDLHEHSHVGEQMAARKQGREAVGGRAAVGEHDASWGSLGGRRIEKTAPAEVSPFRRLVDTSDLKRMILAAEILGPPICLRDEKESRTM